MRSTRWGIGVVLAGALAGHAGSVWAQPRGPNPPQLPPPPPPSNPFKKPFDDFFSNLKNRAIQDADKVDQWTRDAAAAARKAASDFASCPSPDAQSLYDDLKSKRARLVQTHDAAANALADADRALSDCLGTWPDVGPVASPCRLTYSGLPFRGIRDAAQAAINSIDAALKALRALKCIAGCDAYVKIVYPSCNLLTDVLGGASSRVKAGHDTEMTGIQKMSLMAPGDSIEVCVAWEPGGFSANWDSGDGQLSAGVKAKLPKCTRWEKIPAHWCANWDVTRILSRLKQLKLVPPEVMLGDVGLEVPKRDVGYVTVGQAPSCNQPVQVCKRATGNINFDTGADPLTALRGLQGQCAESATIGCGQPPFGFAVERHSAAVPDPAQAKFTWSNPKKPGGIDLDLTKGDFSIACKATGGPGGGPNVGCKPVVFPTPFCMKPRWDSLVGNP